MQTDLRDPETLRQLVLEWQQPMYALAYRLLGNEVDAADATQEIFVRLIAERHHYDSARDFRPWLYRLATRVVLNFMRDSKTRHLREREAAMNSHRPDDRESLDRRELERVVEAALEKLPDDARSLLVLHFYTGLSKVDVAHSLSIPRTTVQSRIQKALELLRRGLVTGGYGAALPNVESIMRSAALPTVPSHVSASLLSIAAKAGASSTALTLGGIVMTKQILAGAAMLAIASLGTGLWIGKSSLHADGPRTGSASSGPDVVTSRAEFEQMKTELARAVARAEKAEADHTRALPDRAATEPAASRHAPTDVTRPPAASPNGVAATKKAGSGIDWSKFGELFAANLDVIKLALTHEDQLTAEQRATLYAAASELAKVAHQANQLSKAPLFDRAIFPELAASLFGKSLDLSPAQLDELLRESRILLDGELQHFDPSTALPAEQWAARRRLRLALDDVVRNLVDENQRARLDDVFAVEAHVLNANETIVELGIAANGLQDELVNDWNHVYSFTPGQMDFVNGLANTYVQEARALLGRYGQIGDNVAPLSSSDAAQLDQLLMLLQSRMEREMDPILTPQQKEAFRSRPPVVIFFRSGIAFHDHQSSGAGF
ncbi:MAG: sigma-70 family RNA polymerase sigma factor [Planctomycetes bacterium]|nr:sigma-70 family RNA polymerase sigma factor [Planctomycetota bacterium]MBI3846609.1 sigma-70 family RNA polymerase sigma factor [Planctomycetota bacterium]